MDAKQFYEENANNTWWNASTDMIEIKADDLWKLMDEYTMHLAKNISSNHMLADSCRFYEQDNTTAMNCKHCGKSKWMH
jgi:hypothetical protein